MDSFASLNYSLNTTSNLIDVYKHILRFGITEENKSLFASSFESIGVEYSTEGVFNTIVTAIKNFFIRLGKFLKEKLIALGEVFVKGWKLIFDKIKKKDVEIPKQQAENFNKLMSGNSSSSEGFGFEFREVNEIDELRADSFLRTLDAETKGTFVRNSDGYYLRTSTVSIMIDSIRIHMVQSFECIVKGKEEPQFNDCHNSYTKPYDGGWGETKKLESIVASIDKAIESFRDINKKANEIINNLNISHEQDLEDLDKAKIYIRNLSKYLTTLQHYSFMFAGVSTACRRAISAKRKVLRNTWDLPNPPGSLSGNVPQWKDSFWGDDSFDSSDIPTFGNL